MTYVCNNQRPYQHLKKSGISAKITRNEVVELSNAKGLNLTRGAVVSAGIAEKSEVESCGHLKNLRSILEHCCDFFQKYAEPRRGRWV